MGRDISVGIATRYGLDGPGIESQVGILETRPGRPPETHPASYTMSTGSFPGVKVPRRGVGHPPPSRTEVKERTQL